jgi:hypothetical protein
LTFLVADLAYPKFHILLIKCLDQYIDDTAPDDCAETHKIDDIEPQVALLKFGNVCLRAFRALGKVRLPQARRAAFTSQNFSELLMLFRVNFRPHRAGETLQSDTP